MACQNCLQYLAAGAQNAAAAAAVLVIFPTPNCTVPEWWDHARFLVLIPTTVPACVHRDIFDVVVCFEEKVMDQVVEGEL
jgi:hypothetical protein